MSKLIKLVIVVIFLFTIFVSNVLSQEVYPNRPITMVCNFGGGGMIDIVTRTICKVAEKELGQPIVNENKPGAGGAIGKNYVLRSKPDGYTLGVTTTGTYLVIPHMRKLPFDVLTDATDIIAVCKYNFGLAVKADAPWNTYEDLIAFVKKNPGKFKYACAGVGVTQHICMERIAMKEGIKWTQVPFKSGGESVMAALGGHTDAVVQGSIDELPHIKAGKLKLLLILSDSRWSDVPNVPHILEKGYNFYALSYVSFYGPKGVSEPIRQKMEDVFKKAMKDPSFMDVMKQFQVEPAYMSGKEYSAHWRSRYEEMGKVIKAIGLVEQ
jgi:tripartite-type tricarboxylate transporter receptor subunit TctC